ncbi:hypothetical protein KJ633_06025 [bacterium]|nr:hypothetical protein [bacterium]MBU3956002.1 hypothetical protein [bacterium]
MSAHIKTGTVPVFSVFSLFLRLLTGVFILLGVSLSYGAGDVGLVFNLSGASSKTLVALCSELESSPSSGASFFIPWDMLEDMRREGINGKLAELFSSGQAELLSGIYYDIDLYRAPEDILYSQIKRFKLLAESVAGTASSGFYPAGMKLSQRSLGALKNIGFKYSLADENCVPEVLEAQRLQTFLMSDGLLLYSVSRKISKAASLPPSRNWIDGFVKTSAVICDDVSGSIPGGAVVFNVEIAGYTSEDVADLFSALRKLNIKLKSIRQLSLKEPSYFKELPSINAEEPKKLSGFQELFLAEWNKFQSMASSFPAHLSENIYKMGKNEYFATPLANENVSKMLSLTEDFYSFSDGFDLSLPGKNIFAVSNGYFRIYFSAKNLNPVLIAVPSLGIIAAGNTSGGVGDYALKTYVNFRSYDNGWEIKKDMKKDSFRITATIKDYPLDIKKTFVMSKGRDVLKYYCSIINSGDLGVSCDVALNMMPAGSSAVYMETTGGNYSGSFQNASKEFGEIKELSFPSGNRAAKLKFVANYPYFLTLRETSAEVSYSKKELSPSDRLLTEAHYSYGDFKAPENAKELFKYSDIFLDGLPNEKLWETAGRFIDPRRDGPDGADISAVYYAQGANIGYIFAEGDFDKTSNFYIAQKGAGSDVMYSKVPAPDKLLYYVKVPVDQGSPSSYRWEGGVWLNTFEKGFSIFAGKSLEIRLPLALTAGDWAVYLESGGKISDSVYFEVK